MWGQVVKGDGKGTRGANQFWLLQPPKGRNLTAEDGKTTGPAEQALGICVENVMFVEQSKRGKGQRIEGNLGGGGQGADLRLTVRG